MKFSIGLMACRVNRYYEDQMRACYSWMRETDPDIKVKFLCGEKDHPSDPDDIIKDRDVIYLPGVGADYMSATDKQFNGLLYLHQHFPADYYLIAGTDNYIVTDRLLGLMKEYDCKPEDEAIVGSHCFYNGHLKIHFFSGGAGLFITHAGMNRLGPLFDQHKKGWEAFVTSKGASYLKPACDVSLFWLAEQYRNADPPFKLINIDKIYGCRPHSTMCMEYTHPEFRWGSVVILHYIETEAQMKYVHSTINVTNYPGHKIQIITQISDHTELDFAGKSTTPGIIWISSSRIAQVANQAPSNYKINCCQDYNWIDLMERSVADPYQLVVWLAPSLLTDQTERWMDDLRYNNRIADNKCYLVASSGYPDLVISPDIMMGSGRIIRIVLDLYRQMIEETNQTDRSTLFKLLYNKYPEIFHLSFGPPQDVLSNLLYPRNSIKTVLEWVKQHRLISSHKITYLICSKIMEVIDTGNLPLGSNTNNYTDTLVEFAAEYYLSCWYNNRKDLCFKLIKLLVKWGQVASVRDSINKRIDYLINTTDFSIPYFKTVHPDYRTVILTQPSDLTQALEHLNNSDIPVLVCIPGYRPNYYSLIGHKIIIRPTLL